MQKLFAGYQELPELLNTASVLYTTCSRALEQALSHEVNGLPRDISPESPIVAEGGCKMATRTSFLPDRYLIR